MINSFKNLLIELGLSTEASIKPYFPRVRDSENIEVLHCNKSGVYFLSDNSLSSEQNYRNIDSFSYWENDWNKHKANLAKTPQIFADDHRRVNQFMPYIKAKNWLDFGCGNGGALRLAHMEAKIAIGLEVQQGPRNFLNSIDIKCTDTLEEIPDNSLDTITLFHVYEHLQNPIEILDSLSKKLVKNGTLIIEVPQANDILLSLFNLNSFKSFTFWSEHLILHTRTSLSQFLQTCSSFQINAIEGYQRYPLSNHLYWLSKSLPGGHEKWAFLNNSAINEAYSQTLQSIDKTDTLIAYITKK